MVLRYVGWCGMKLFYYWLFIGRITLQNAIFVYLIYLVFGVGLWLLMCDVCPSMSEVLKSKPIVKNIAAEIIYVVFFRFRENSSFLFWVLPSDMALVIVVMWRVAMWKWLCFITPTELTMSRLSWSANLLIFVIFPIFISFQCYSGPPSAAIIWENMRKFWYIFNHCNFFLSAYSVSIFASTVLAADCKHFEWIDVAGGGECYSIYCCHTRADTGHQNQRKSRFEWEISGESFNFIHRGNESFFDFECHFMSICFVIVQFLFQISKATESYQQLVEQGLPQLTKFLERQKSHKRELAALAQIRPKTKSIIESLLQPIEPMGLITHTDFWCNNLLMNHTTDSVNCVILDWQMITYSRWVFDFHSSS